MEFICKFRVKDGDGEVYSLYSSFYGYIVRWGSEGCMEYGEESVDKFLKDGTWVVYKEPVKVTEIQEFKSMKFRVNSPEHSKQIQEYLFSLGYSKQIQAYLFSLGCWWQSGDQHELNEYNCEYLYTNDNGKITYGSYNSYFEKDGRQEYTLKATTTYSLEAVETPPEMIIIDGVEYDKARVLKALEGLK